MSEKGFAGQHINAVRTGGIGTLWLNRPKKLNALLPDMRTDLLAAFDQLENDSAVRVVILTGRGRGFCAGGDIDYLEKLKRTGDREGFCRILEEGTELVRRFRASPKSIIAAINGPAVGGGLILALACDLRYAAAAAIMGMPFAKIGMGPDWGGTWMLTELVGSAKALELLLTASKIGAQEARSMGLVNHVSPDEKLLDVVISTAERIARFDPDIPARYKRIISTAVVDNQKAALAVERRCQLEFFDHPHFIERVTRFRVANGSRHRAE